MSIFKKMTPREYDSWRKTEIILNLCVKHKILTVEEAQKARENNGLLPQDIWVRIFKKSISNN